MDFKVIIGSFAIVAQVVALLAYVPQFRHLWRVKDSSGMSATTWAMWVFASLLLLIYAITIRDFVFTVALTLAVLADSTVLFMTLKYRRRPA